jgi:hypothetical protein
MFNPNTSTITTTKSVSHLNITAEIKQQIVITTHKNIALSALLTTCIKAFHNKPSILLNPEIHYRVH